MFEARSTKKFMVHRVHRFVHMKRVPAPFDEVAEFYGFSVFFVSGPFRYTIF